MTKEQIKIELENRKREAEKKINSGSISDFTADRLKDYIETLNEILELFV